MLFRGIECVRGWLMPYPWWIRKLGKKGEYLARRNFHRRGYHLVARNWRSGRGEIDLIMANSKKLIFLEVKTRTQMPERGISDVLTWNQERRLLALADAYVNSLKVPSLAWDLILVLIVLDRNQIKTFHTATIRRG